MYIVLKEKNKGYWQVYFFFDDGFFDDFNLNYGSLKIYDQIYVEVIVRRNDDSVVEQC